MSKMSNIALTLQNMENQIEICNRNVIDVEMKNQELTKALRWALGVVKFTEFEDDHDCTASPDDGCAWCHDHQNALSLIGDGKPEPDIKAQREQREENDIER